METTTVNEEFYCPEHNVYICECECDGMYCPHGTYVPDYLIRLALQSNAVRTRALQKCPCGMYKYDALPEETLKPKSSAGDDRPGNWYLITLTQPDLDKTIDKRILAAKKIIRSKQVAPEQWCYSIELTQKGTPHVHIALFTYKYPEFRIIKSFNDGYGVDIQREKYNIRNYVVKDETKPSPAHLATWGLEGWFYCSDNYSGPRPGVPDSPTRVIELV